MVYLQQSRSGLVNIVKSIKNKFVSCKNLFRKEYLTLPVDRLKPTLPWLYSSVDLFGQYTTKGGVNKRSRGKVYGLILDCIVTRAVYIDVEVDYSTEGFLMAFRRFVSLHGYPKQLYSDRGTQLVGTSKELKGIIKGLIEERFTKNVSPNEYIVVNHIQQLSVLFKD